MTPKPSDLITVATVAEILQVRKPNVYRIKDLPKAKQQTPAGQLWRRGDIERFAVGWLEARAKRVAEQKRKAKNQRDRDRRAAKKAAA